MTTLARKVTIELTAKQRSSIRQMTGRDESELRLDVPAKGSGKKALAPKAAPTHPRFGRPDGSVGWQVA